MRLLHILCILGMIDDIAKCVVLSSSQELNMFGCSAAIEKVVIARNASSEVISFLEKSLTISSKDLSE